MATAPEPCSVKLIGCTVMTVPETGVELKTVVKLKQVSQKQNCEKCLSIFVR